MTVNQVLSSTVATIVANHKTVLEPALVGQAAEDTCAINIIWLAERMAVDLFYNNSDLDSLHRFLKARFSSMACDVFVQPVNLRRKRLLVADMESTIIEQEMLDEMAELIGCRDRVADITRRAMNGELDFGQALRERVCLFRGQPQAILEQVAGHMTLMSGADKLVATMKRNGAQCWLVSGGFTFFADRIGQQLGFDRVCANKLIIENRVITGEVADPVLDKKAKLDILDLACRENSLVTGQSLSVGDGANDVPMLEACQQGLGLGVAYRAKPNVRSVISHQVNECDLTALLYAQGYSTQEQVAPST